MKDHEPVPSATAPPISFPSTNIWIKSVGSAVPLIVRVLILVVVPVVGLDMTGGGGDGCWANARFDMVGDDKSFSIDRLAEVVD